MTIYQILSLLGLPSLIGAVLISIYNWAHSRYSSNKLIRDGVLAILHNKIYTLGKQYIERGFLLSIEELDDLEHLYNAYHALGGNGTGTEIFKRVKELPIRQERSYYE